MPDGPRAVRRDELDELSELVDAIFMGRDEGTMFEQFNRLFHPERLEQMRVVRADGRLAAHVGMVLERACLLGCELGIATIGAVCCRAELRGRGYATALMRDAIDLARRAGASVMLISGGRGLYRRLGAQNGGCYRQYEVPLESLADDPGLELATVTPGHAEAALRLFEVEPIRWRRSAAEYDLMLQTGVVACRFGSTHLVRRGGEPVATVTVSIRRQRDEGWARLLVAETAGSRAAILGVLPRLVAQYEATEVRWPAYDTDLAVCELALRHGLPQRSISHEGTIRVLDLPRLLDDFGPLLRDRLGAAGELSMDLRAAGDGYDRLAVTGFGERLEMEGDTAIIALLFGTTGEQPLAGRGGRLIDALRRALPLPLPMYGLNYA